MPVVYDATNGVWETLSNWNSDPVPSAGQADHVQSGSVTLSSTSAIDSLTMGAAAGGATFTTLTPR